MPYRGKSGRPRQPERPVASPTSGSPGIRPGLIHGRTEGLAVALVKINVIPVAVGTRRQGPRGTVVRIRPAVIVRIIPIETAAGISREADPQPEPAGRVEVIHPEGRAVE